MDPQITAKRPAVIAFKLVAYGSKKIRENDVVIKGNPTHGKYFALVIFMLFGCNPLCLQVVYGGNVFV
jgi:hypothetical protein